MNARSHCHPWAAVVKFMCWHDWPSGCKSLYFLFQLSSCLQGAVLRTVTAERVAASCAYWASVWSLPGTFFSSSEPSRLTPSVTLYSEETQVENSFKSRNLSEPNGPQALEALDRSKRPSGYTLINLILGLYSLGNVFSFPWNVPFNSLLQSAFQILCVSSWPGAFCFSSQGFFYGNSSSGLWISLMREFKHFSIL